MTLEFGTTQLRAQPILGIRTATRMDETLGQVMGALFGEVMGYIVQRGQAPAGMPLAIYHSMGENLDVDLECGIPVASAIEDRGRIAAGELPAGKVATVTHVGPYHELGKTWDALKVWMDSQGLEPAKAPCWEVYVSDPRAEPDQSKWRTDIFYPIK